MRSLAGNKLLDEEAEGEKKTDGGDGRGDQEADLAEGGLVEEGVKGHIEPENSQVKGRPPFEKDTEHKEGKKNQAWNKDRRLEKGVWESGKGSLPSFQQKRHGRSGHGKERKEPLVWIQR